MNAPMIAPMQIAPFVAFINRCSHKMMLTIFAFWQHNNPPFGRAASAQIGMKERRQTTAFLIKLL